MHLDLSQQPVLEFLNIDHRLQLPIAHTSQELCLQQLQSCLHRIERSLATLLRLGYQLINIQQELRLRPPLSLDLIIQPEQVLRAFQVDLRITLSSTRNLRNLMEELKLSLCEVVRVQQHFVIEIEFFD